jgi:hypothetical protein
MKAAGGRRLTGAGLGVHFTYIEPNWRVEGDMPAALQRALMRWLEMGWDYGSLSL